MCAFSPNRFAGAGVRRASGMLAGAFAVTLAFAGCSGDGPASNVKPAPPPAPATTQPAPGGSEGSVDPSTPNAAVDPAVLDASPEFMVVGEQDAPNTIEVYFDYLCPHCATYALEQEPSIIKKYVETGRAKLQYRDFLVIDPDASAQLAVFARLVAAETGDYSKIHQLLMENQQQLFDGFELDETLLIKLGNEAGASDSKQYAELSRGEQNAGGVLQSQQIGRDTGVSGTPSIAVNGELLSSSEIGSIDRRLK
nr:DsbA family protein [Pseudoclavibacter sp. Marseille-Q3772]